jgi:hypothetical protein
MIKFNYFVFVCCILFGACQLGPSVQRGYLDQKDEQVINDNFNNRLSQNNHSYVLPDSLKNDTILIALKSQYRMHLYYSGRLIKSYVIALGQNPIGHKEEQGDNKTPEGDYRIIQKTVGPFTGNYAAYLGSRWMRLNYPNNVDAKNGLQRGRISKAQYDAIVKANLNNKEPLKTTKLGGGIGIHGWNGPWPGTDRQDLTWGCISLQNQENEDLYNRIKVGCRVLILP